MIDEYLWGEPVFEKKRPVYFLLDMGKLKIANNIYKQKIESVTGEPVKQEGYYESFDMKFVDLKIFHTHVDVISLLDEARMETETFQVFEKFDFGIQYQSLIDKDSSSTLPDTIVNLNLKEVRLNFDRIVLNQLFKVKSFYFNGSYNLALEFLSAQKNRMA